MGPKTGYYLLDRPNPHGDHFHATRRSHIKGIVIHITAGLEDRDMHDDQSAEATAHYAATTSRPVSWHAGADCDSWLHLLPADYTAFHVQGHNSCSLGLELSKHDTRWSGMDPEWVRRTLRNGAEVVRQWMVAWGIPARKVSAREWAAGQRGLIGHSELDPERRSDPGADFPWEQFLAYCAGSEGGDDLTPQESATLMAAHAAVGRMEPIVTASHQAMARMETAVRDPVSGLAARLDATSEHLASMETRLSALERFLRGDESSYE